MSDAQLESLILDHFLELSPELDQITISVRGGGELLRYVLLRPNAEAISYDRAACEETLLATC